MNPSNSSRKTAAEVEILFCSFAPTGLEDYVTYIRNRFKRATYLEFKFPHGKRATHRSSVTTFKDGGIVSKKTLLSLPKASNAFLYFMLLPVHYLLYLWQAITRLWHREPGITRVFIGVNYYCAICGIILKKLGRVDFVVYRCMDFFPLPPAGIYRILNRLFFLLDRICLRYANVVWFTTRAHIAGREKYGYFRDKHIPFEMIPLGINTGKLRMKAVENRIPHSLVYCGVISKYHKIGLLFDVVKGLKNKYDDIRLQMIGSGPDEHYFRKKAVEMGLESNIVFHGYVGDGARFDDLMSENLLGIALYEDEENFMRYTEPAKVKYYLSYGVPVILSAVPPIAEELHRKKVCFAVRNNLEDICSIIDTYFTDHALQKEFETNIMQYVRTVDIDLLLTGMFDKLIENYLNIDPQTPAFQRHGNELPRT